METCYVDYDTRTIADLLPPRELTPGWTISRINVPAESRGEGHGSKMLKRILADADADQVSIWLEISSSGPLDNKALERWYRRYGFKLHQQTGYYVRRPRKPKVHS